MDLFPAMEVSVLIVANPSTEVNVSVLIVANPSTEVNTTMPKRIYSRIVVRRTTSISMSFNTWSIQSSKPPVSSNVNDFDDSTDPSSGKNSFKNPITSLSLMSPKGSSSHSPQTISTSTPSKWANQSSCNSLNSPTVTNGSNSNSSMNGSSKKHNKNMVTNNLVTPKDDFIMRLEADIKRLKADLQSSRQTEQELRSQINSLASEERGSKAEICQLLQDNENLQTKLHNLVTARQQDKQNISNLEKKILEEKKNKASLETQLSTERKAKKDAVEVAASTNRTLAIAAASRTPSGDCTESCKSKRRELENDLKQLKRELKLREEQLRQLDREAQVRFNSLFFFLCFFSLSFSLLSVPLYPSDVLVLIIL